METILGISKDCVVKRQPTKPNAPTDRHRPNADDWNDETKKEEAFVVAEFRFKWNGKWISIISLSNLLLSKLKF